MFDVQHNSILVVGDVMIDRYLEGGISRKSPEADVPVFSWVSESNFPGGAANVAVNIKELGGQPVLLGITGNDNYGELLEKLLDTDYQITSYLLRDESRKTTVKTRVISEGTHLLRLDSEDTFFTDEKIRGKLKDAFQKILETNRPDGVILQDYNKGLLTKDLISYILMRCQEEKIPVFVDPKFTNFMEYKGTTVFKPNLKELEAALNRQLTVRDLMEGDFLEQLRLRLQCQIVFVTLSGDGIIYLDGKEKRHIPAFPRDVIDVCGAGDTVIATIAMAYISGYSTQATGIMANIAGGQVCEHSGVVPVRLQPFLREYSDRTQNGEQPDQ